MNPCDDRKLDLLRYLENDLTGQELKYFRAHLEACSYCQGRLEREKALSDLLRESRPLFPAPGELRAKISTAMEQHAARRGFQWKWWRHSPRLMLSWRMLVPGGLMIAVCLIAVPSMVQNVRAASYVGMALENHKRYLEGSLRPEIRSSSPDEVAAWLAGRLPFRFRLPSSAPAFEANPVYQLAGARLVEYRASPAAMVVYQAPSGAISLLVTSSKFAVIAGGDEVHYGALTFHYRSEDKFNVITWNNHDLSYALVSTIASSAQDSCMVCHQSLADHGQFRQHSGEVLKGN